jgi:hypothetical protein
MIIALFAVLALQAAPPPTTAPSAGSDSAGAAAQREAEAAATLDRMHQAAAQADGATYFAQFSDSARVVGADASEHWDIGAFKAYAEPLFARGQGWTYRPYDRTLIVSGDVAWFDEKLDNDSYGALRGSGLLRRTGPEGEWKIEQYVLSFTVPNDRARAVAALIKSDAAD